MVILDVVIVKLRVDTSKLSDMYIFLGNLNYLVKLMRLRITVVMYTFLYYFSNHVLNFSTRMNMGSEEFLHCIIYRPNLERQSSMWCRTMCKMQCIKFSLVLLAKLQNYGFLQVYDNSLHSIISTGNFLSLYSSQIGRILDKKRNWNLLTNYC